MKKLIDKRNELNMEKDVIDKADIGYLDFIQVPDKKDKELPREKGVDEFGSNELLNFFTHWRRSLSEMVSLGARLLNLWLITILMLHKYFT